MDHGSLRRKRRQAQSREAAARKDDASARRSLESADERTLMEAMRRNEAAAIEEFLIRYDRLLFDRARAAGIPRLDCEDCITELLEDVATAIICNEAPNIASLSGFLVRAFRNRFTNLSISQQRKAKRVAESGVRPEEGIAEGAGSSEYARRSSAGSSAEQPRISAPIQRLLQALEADLSSEERLILGWLSNYVPQRVIAQWLNVTYAAATQRIWRLRQRLRDTATRHASKATDEDRRELEKFFRRAGTPVNPKEEA